MRRKDDATYLGAGAGKIRTEHDYPRGGVRELLAAGLEAVFEELDVSTTAVAALLVLDLVLHDERLRLEVDRLAEWGRDSMMSGLGLGYETFVACDNRDRGLLDLPLADIAECLAANGGLLGRL